MNKTYIIHKEPGKFNINDGDKLRVDLYNGCKIKDINELKDFTIKYFTKGHKDQYRIVRYITVHKKY